MRSILLSVLVLSLTGLAPGQAAVRNYLGRDHFPISPGDAVRADVLDLDLSARGAEVPILRCTTDIKISGAGSEKADSWIAAHTPQFESTEGQLRIQLLPQKTGFLGLGALTQRRRMHLVLPLSSIPDLSTSSGNIELTGDFSQADPLRLRSGGGKIEFSGAAKSLEIRSTSGPSTIRVFRPVKKLWARTSSGGISFTGGAKEVHIETASGPIQIHGLLDGASVETVSGTIELQWDRLPAEAKIKIRSASGDIHIYLPPEAEPSGGLSTTTGELHSEFPSQATSESTTIHLEGSGPALEVETASGDIYLLRDEE